MKQYTVCSFGIIRSKFDKFTIPAAAAGTLGGGREGLGRLLDTVSVTLTPADTSSLARRRSKTDILGCVFGGMVLELIVELHKFNIIIEKSHQQFFIASISSNNNDIKTDRNEHR